VPREDLEALIDRGMDGLAGDGAAELDGERHEVRGAATVLVAAQDDGALAGDAVLLEVDAARHDAQAARRRPS
jgi:hypothetical protein